jgi:hypothetical protein
MFDNFKPLFLNPALRVHLPKLMWPIDKKRLETHGLGSECGNMAIVGHSNFWADAKLVPVNVGP